MKTDEDTIEYKKLQGFDVMEKLPEEKLISTYNEQFYSSLSSMKFISCTIPDEHKLFYHFEQNENVSVTTTVAQLLKTFEELYTENEFVKKIFKNIKAEILSIYSSYDNFDTNIIDNMLPEIKKMEANLKNFLINQKTENFKLIKEIAILEKEKNEIHDQIEIALEKCNRLEQAVGMKGKSTSICDGEMIKKNNTESELTEKFNINYNKV